jgi:hypothetical protein
LKVTKLLREFDIGMLTLGARTLDLLIPPLDTPPSIISECGSKCLTRPGVFPEDGITVLSTILHMHKRGYSISAKHVRGGNELEPLPSQS